LSLLKEVVGGEEHKSIKQVLAEETNYSKSAKTHTGIGDNEVASLIRCI